MGYYIHNCVKMRYKGDYKPQYVLDPMSYEWNPLDVEMRSLLDKRKFVSLSCRRNDADVEATAEGPEDNVLFQGPDGTDWKHLPPAKAAGSGDSLLVIRMPGVLTLQEVQKGIDLDHIQIAIDKGGKTFDTEVRSERDRPCGWTGHSLTRSRTLCLGITMTLSQMRRL